MNKRQIALAALAPLLLGVGAYSFNNFQAEVPIGIESQIKTPLTEAKTDVFAQVLESHVDQQGLVDYKKLQTNRTALDEYNASLYAIAPGTYENWSDDEKIAYWINAYNSLTLKAIINETPLKSSIRDIFGVWRLKKHPVLQSSKTLNAIEHDILRPEFNEPRIHAALVCAAISCPYLRLEPYSGENLDEQLDDQVKIFLSRPEAFEIDRTKNEVRLSAIFDWFGEDWVPSYGTDEGFAGSKNERAVLNFISGYLEESDREYLKAGGYKVSYATYDWSLNIQP